MRSCLQPDNDREIKAASSAIYLLHNAHSPAVLAECGFLSNETEAKNMLDDEWKNKMAQGIAQGIMAFLHI